MDEFESQIREALARAIAVSPSGPLPSAVRHRVHLRQTKSVGGTALVMAVFLACAALLPQWLSSRDLSTAGQGATSPPTIRPVAPGSYGSWPKVKYGGPQTPYIDHVAGEATHLVTPKTVVTYGTANGVQWSAAAYMWKVHADSPAIPCVELFVGDVGPGGGGGCLRTGTFSLSGAMSGSGMNGLQGYNGELAPAVASVIVRLADGQTRHLRIFTGPAGVTANFVVFFPPRGATGTVVAEDESGRVLGRAYLCPPPLPGRAPACPG